jgi:hypothetical protein
MRLADGLYYTLSDPSGTSMQIVDSQGITAGHVLSDPYGRVIDKNLTSEFEEALAGTGSLVDPTTGLVHLGGGRFYAPELGRSLQPDPMGGPPVVPQALNRYAATVVGQPGVAEAAAPSFTGLSLAASFVKSAAAETLARTTWGPLGYAQTRILREAYAEISVTASNTAMKNAARRIEELGGGLLDPSVGLGKAGSGKYTRVFKLGQGLTTVDDLIRDANLPTTRGWNAILKINNVDEVVKTSRFARLGWLSNAKGNVLFDAALSAGFQWWEDSYNPYLSPIQKGGRSGIVAIGGGVSSGIGLFAGSLACGPGAGICATGVVVAITTAMIVNAFWSYKVQPWIFDKVEPLQPPPRNLKPLTMN